jgi:hypothetical protein
VSLHRRSSAETASASSGRWSWYRLGIPLFASLDNMVQSQTEEGITPISWTQFRTHFYTLFSTRE